MKEAGKQTTIATIVMSVIGAIGYQPVVAWAEEAIAEIATKEVTLRIDKVEETQSSILSEQRSIREAQAASEVIRKADSMSQRERLDLVIKMLTEQRQP